MKGFEPITMKDQCLIEKILGRNVPHASEMTFTYMYMWRDDYCFSYTIAHGYLLILSESDCDIPFMLSPLPVDGKYAEESFKKVVYWLLACFQKEGKALAFGRVEEGLLPWFQLLGEAFFRFEPSETTADYVYLGEEMRSLSGRKFASKRNHISQFKRQHGQYDILPIQKEHLGECKRIMEEWCIERDCQCTSPQGCERYAFNQLAVVWDQMPVSGILIRIHGKFEAFTVGEQLNADTVVVRFEKGNTAVHGIYTVVFQDYMTHHWQDALYVNREEDMGKEGLRKAKESYYPCHMLKKFTIYYIGQ